MSKSLIKLIDSALIPAACMICGKVVGLWFANTAFGLNWGITSDPNNFFSVKIVYASVEDQITAASYSNLIMFLFVLFGFSLVLTRALFFNSRRVSPAMLAKLATNNLLNLIRDSFEIYHHASVWLVVLWLSLIALLLNVFIGRAYIWTGTISMICTIFTTIILLRDVTAEIKLAKKDPASVITHRNQSNLNDDKTTKPTQD